MNIYGYEFNIEVDLCESEINDILTVRARYRHHNDWLPEFGNWQVMVIQPTGEKFEFEVGVRKEGGKRINYFKFDLREVKLIPESNPNELKKWMDKFTVNTFKKIIS